MATTQKNLIKLKYIDKEGVPHYIYTRKNTRKLAEHKLALRKYNKKERKYVLYKESKK